MLSAVGNVLCSDAGSVDSAGCDLCVVAGRKEGRVEGRGNRQMMTAC